MTSGGPAIFSLALIALDAAMVVALFAVKRREKKRFRRTSAALAAIVPPLERGEALPGDIPRSEVFDAVVAGEDRFVLSRAARETVARRMGLGREWRREISRLSSGSRTVRALGAFRLRYFDRERSVEALNARLRVERTRTVKLRIADSLVNLGEAVSVDAILDSLHGESPEFAERMVAVCSPLAGAFAAAFARRKPVDESERLFFIRSARRYPCEAYGDFLLAEAERGGPLGREAARVLLKTRPSVLESPRFLSNPDPDVRSIAVGSLGRRDDPAGIERLFSFLSDPETRDAGMYALRVLVSRSAGNLKRILRRFYREEDPVVRDALADILQDRIDFFLYDILTQRGMAVRKLAETLLDSGRPFGIASFLNRNRDARIEEEIFRSVRPRLAGRDDLARGFAAALKPDVRERLGLPPSETPGRTRRPVAKPEDRPVMIAALFLLVLAPVAAFMLGRGPAGIDPAAALSSFSRGYVSTFAFYAIAVNAVSLFLLFFSTRELAERLRAKRSRSASSLYTENMLPSVSIIVPAFREEKSIVESVKALLNMKYPEYEVIVVNDGSPDRTMETLIESFGLERTEPRRISVIGTEPTLGWYRCPGRPELLVIDKANGGKADALNAGIEAARRDYVCGIDADSILEPDALLRAAALTLDSEEELVAAGGNILPVNGCDIRSGDLARIGIPSSPIAAFQTVEYLRAFLSGRLGWARLKCLLIISGAFGLFSRKRVVEAGGYMTRNGPMRKDTVGEDMELVVRLARTLRERNIPHAIRYAFDANCWTEVPEDLRTLSRQRDRWQRGLLEILSRHRAMIMNPRYGRIGLVGMPYYLLFETIGPFYELLGYAAATVSLALGLIDAGTALFAFASAVLSGVLVSVASLAAAERQVLYFSVKETWKLLAFAVLENFGYRQLMGATRATAYVGYLFGHGGWGAQKRKGFAAGTAGTGTAGTGTKPAAP